MSGDEQLGRLRLTFTDVRIVDSTDMRSCAVCSRLFPVKDDHQRNAVEARCPDCARANKHPRRPSRV